MIQAQVIADSKNEFGNRITTMVVTFPRIILAEFNTHRMFSRNSASSRAIPFEKMVKSVEENPFIPIAWQKDHKGMQGTEYFTNNDITKPLPDNDYSIDIPTLSSNEWLVARDHAISRAKYLHSLGVTKQLCNRLLEPFMWHTVIVTATEWENFFALRCPKYNIGTPTLDNSRMFGLSGDRYWRSWKDVVGSIKDAGEDIALKVSNASVLERLRDNKGQAEIHMMALAEAMWDAYNESTPKELKAGEWHIPFGDNINLQVLYNSTGNPGTVVDEKECRKYLAEELIKIATARCARVSYTVVGEEGKPDNYENDIKLHDRLAASGHWSPFEHCAKAMTFIERSCNVNGEGYLCHEEGVEFSENEKALGWSGNFRGFIQYRKMFDNENITNSSL